MKSVKGLWSSLPQTLPQALAGEHRSFARFIRQRKELDKRLEKLSGEPDAALSLALKDILTSPNRRRLRSPADNRRLQILESKLPAARTPQTYSRLFLQSLLYAPLPALELPKVERLAPWLAPFIAEALNNQPIISVVDDEAATLHAMDWIVAFITALRKGRLPGGQTAWKKIWLPTIGTSIHIFDYHTSQINLAPFAGFIGALQEEAFKALPTKSQGSYRVLGTPDAKKKRLRVGLFCSHIVTHWHGLPHILGWINHLDRQKYELLVIVQDAPHYAQPLTRLFEHYPFLPEMAPFVLVAPGALDKLKDFDLDILFNVDGHGRGIHDYVAFQRLAKHQMTAFYTPATTGCPQMDYYITSRALDPMPQRAFTEKRIDSDGLPFCFHFTSYFGIEPRLSRQDLGLAKDSLILTVGSSMTTKIRPAFLQALISIMARVPKAELLAMPIEPPHARGLLLECLERECAAQKVDPKRIKLLPFASREILYSVIAAADLFLDFFPFSGTNNLLDPLYLSVPCLTVCPPEGHSRNRIGGEILKTLGLPELVVESPQAFMDEAVRLCRDSKARASIKKRLGPELLRRSALCDGEAFVARMEKAFDLVLKRQRP